MKRILLISITLFILILGISCASAATVDHNAGSILKKDYQGNIVKVGNPSIKVVSKKVAIEKASVKKAAKKSSKKATKNTAKKSSRAAKKSSVKKVTVNKVTKKSDTPANIAAKKSVRPVDKIVNGWNPKKHQVSSKSIGGGLYKVTYDDGYYRIIDSNGNILSYGF